MGIWQRVGDFFTGRKRLYAAPGTVVEPPSGSTSFHCWWQGVDGGAPIVAASVVLEVLQEPVAPRLYFWALQVGFAQDRRNTGAAHIGLQWNPRHSGSRAVNWGGYADVGNVHSVLDGTPSPLASTVDDPNTRDFPWRAGVPYRLTVLKGTAGWRGEITDTTTGQTWHIRDLLVEADRLTGFVVWSELFCACTDPQVVVRWTEPVVRTAAGEERVPNSVRVTFPGGGCPNVDTVSTPDGLVQIANTTRTARDGYVLHWRLPG